MLICLDRKADQRLANGLLLERRAKLKSQSGSDLLCFYSTMQAHQCITCKQTLISGVCYSYCQTAFCLPDQNIYVMRYSKYKNTQAGDLEYRHLNRRNNIKLSSIAILIGHKHLSSKMQQFICSDSPLLSTAIQVEL